MQPLCSDLSHVKWAFTTQTQNPLVPQLVAHVSANKVILRRWEEGNVREWSAISYPNQASAQWESQNVKQVGQMKSCLSNMLSSSRCTFRRPPFLPSGCLPAAARLHHQREFKRIKRNPSVRLITDLCATLSSQDYAAARLHHQRVQVHQAQSVDPLHFWYHSLPSPVCSS